MSDTTEFVLEPGTFDSSSRLLDDVGALLNAPAKVRTRRTVATEVKKSVRRFGRESSPEEFDVLRTVINELVFQINEISMHPSGASGRERQQADATPEDVAEENVIQDSVVQATLGAARAQAPLPMTTPTSIAAGDAAMAASHTSALATLRARIESGELIGSAALQSALDIKRQAISNAVKAGRLFALTGPSGDNYYPAFYADPGLDRRAVEKVAKALGTLPGASKLFFFTSKSTLLRETPLEALRQGRLAEVLTAAAGFIGR